MLRFTAHRADGRPVIGLGLEAVNIERLKAGEPIALHLDELDPQLAGDLVLFYGVDQRALLDSLAGQITTDTVVNARITPARDVFTIGSRRFRFFHGARRGDLEQIRVYVTDDPEDRDEAQRVDLALPAIDPKHEYLHSPTGFEWGYAGSGPAELARALLMACYPDHKPGEGVRAPAVYQRFKERVVAHLPRDEWVLTREAIRAEAHGLLEDYRIAFGDRA